ncbi:MAG: sodium:calcium antiporter, partial [Treponema sp.]|nr:sodium:calcium antiporter [Treponema sp.]
MLFLNILLLLVGFVALIKGADFFVDGSSSLAKIFKVPGVIIGLTVVAMGTSLPELAVSTSAALRGSNEIAISNVTGSNIFNILCVLGFCALIHKVPVNPSILKRDYPFCILVSVFVPLAAAFSSITGGHFFTLKMSDN